MKTFKLNIAKTISDAVASSFAGATLAESEILDLLEYPTDTSMGDIALPCFKLSRILRKAPPVIAKEISESLKSDVISKAEAVNGYLNIFVSNEYLLNNVLFKIEEEKEEVVKFKDKEVKIPKSKVSSVKSAEDAETNKKTGGDKVSQDQAQTMFENVGQKSMGIDVSHHQGKIDWAQVRASGVEFAIIRAGYRGQTSGGIYEDAYFKTNMKGAIANGIKVGVYLW